MSAPKRDNLLDRELVDAAFVCDLVRVRELLAQLPAVGRDPTPARAIGILVDVPKAILIGAAVGLGLAALLAWGWARYGQRVNLALFFKVTSVFLILFAFQLVLNAFHEATEANVLPIDNAYWHLATEPYGPEGHYGALLTYALVLVPAVWLVVAAVQARQVAHEPRLTS